MLRHGRLLGPLQRTLAVASASTSQPPLPLRRSYTAVAGPILRQTLANLNNPYSHASTATVTVPASVMRLPTLPGSKVQLDSSVTRSQAAQQMVLALLHKKEEADRKLKDQGKEFIIFGLTHQEIWTQVEEEFPEKPFPPAPDHPQRLGKKGKIKQSPPSQPRPGHAIHSMKYLKGLILPELVARNLVRKMHMQRPPASDLEYQRLYAKAKKIAKRAKLKGKESLPAEELQAAEGTIASAQAQLVDIWRWELVPEQERLDMEAKRAAREAYREAAKERLREDGRPELAPYGAGRLDHLSDRRRATREAEEASVRRQIGQSPFSFPPGSASAAGGLRSPSPIGVRSSQLGTGPPRGPRAHAHAQPGSAEFAPTGPSGLSVADKLRVPVIPPTGLPDKKAIQAVRRVVRKKAKTAKRKLGRR
ncbi:hypothetical protein CALVIDRAFT_533223 [Calocera viscosa TUFC12733]|uniref:Uncharacterized protein n=1 Tax=Calocera viscosa (strain TUFC12733) TaxID=1330018 RepID=A0A167RGU5_CALVF|nr:hypothetical protein CALVIDRAFT_533223 [Calocera viscosa TUFC12733]